MSKRLELYQE